MALDRPSIEKKDFPISDRGYEAAAVDAHLAALADEVEELKRSSARATGSLAASTSEQVRAIIEAAETSALEIRRRAEDAAREIRERASSEARGREQATSQARGYLEKVSTAAATMRERLEAMETEMRALLNTARSDEQREPGGQEAVWREPTHDPVAESQASVAAREDEGAADGRSDDAESARLIALNMALNDTPREEIDGYLAAHYRLTDRGKLLDEVYASLGP